MKKHHALRSRVRKHSKLIASIGLLLIWVSCARFQAREGWNQRLGPVVPHDTFPADCTLCHLGSDWHTFREDFAYDHAAETGLELTGAHTQAQCLLCHNDRGPVAAFADRGCAGCHVDVHLGRLGNTCDSCHNDENWRPLEAISNHNRTRFPLIGAHTVVECFRCHEGAESGVFLAMDVSCATCHLDDYQATANPDHLASGFGTDCQDCHIAVAWSGASAMAHPGSLPLTGGHGGLDCTECHTPGVFTGLSPDCVTCHAADAQGATVSHSGFSTQCQFCHNTATWSGPNFDHPPSFPLTGGHRAPSCTDCHLGGVLVGLSTDCASCHLDEYQATTNPDHQVSGFSTNCQDCHGTNSWFGAVFNHTFPISGPHNLDCTECHLNPSVPSEFSCTHCHEHRESEMADDHSEVDGYAWFSPLCLSCHPNGKH